MSLNCSLLLNMRMGKLQAIFEDAGFDVNIIGIKRIDSASLRWRKAYNDKGILGLEDTRTLNSGRTLNRG